VIFTKFNITVSLTEVVLHQMIVNKQSGFREQVMIHFKVQL